ncbi:Pyruvate dehydrogenase [Diplonema papillatum]|nr:Pyruvate dehydrogenase [Diplonema papillatum]
MKSSKQLLKQPTNQKRLVGQAAAAVRTGKVLPTPLDAWKRAVSEGGTPGIALHSAVMAQALNHQAGVHVVGAKPKVITRVPDERQTEVPMDGNQATTYIAYAISEQALIYPISPATSMGEHMDNWSAAGRRNIFNDIPQVSMMQSEGGAAGALHGCLTTGSLATTFTASQGLLLMIPNLYLIAGELMPCVIHVSARTLAKHSLSIFNDHSDVMACRQTGFAMLCSSSVQEVMDLSLVSHMATLKARVPFMHFFDGWRTSAGIQKIRTVPYDEIHQIFPHEALQSNLRNVALNPNHPIIRGVGQRPDIFFQNSVAANKFYDATPSIVEETMDEFRQLTGRSYELVQYYGAPDAERVIVVMGSAAETCQETVDHLIGLGEKVGVVKVRLFRPWPTERFLDAIPKTCTSLCVLDRTKEDGALGNPLYLDVCASHSDYDVRRKIVGGVFGLASKEFTPGQVIALFDNLKQKQPKNHFNIGILDDVTHTSIPFNDNINIVKDTTQCIFWGLGGDGTIGANKAAIKTITMDAGLFGQAYFNYDSHKENGATISHLRFGTKPIRAEYMICAGADYIACHHPSYVRKYDMLAPLREGGTFVLNCVWNTVEDIEANFPARLRRQIAGAKAKFYVINATKMALDLGLGHRINTIMQASFYLRSGVLPVEDAMKYLKGSIVELYTKKGPKVVEANMKAVDAAESGLHEIAYPESWNQAEGSLVFTAEGASRKLFEHKNIPRAINDQVDEFIERMMDPMLELEGDKLPVSAMTPGGYMPSATCMQEKRGLAPEVPVWIPDKCTQCNYCAIVCPHAVIRPFLLDKTESKTAPAGFEFRKAQGGAEMGGFNYTIQLASMDCTGCAICVQSCPDDALRMEPFETVAESQVPSWEYAINLPPRNPIGNHTVKGSQFSTPLMEFSGACPGCGETPYVKLLTQLFGERLVIANSSGCSSVWGGTAGTNPYTVTKDGRGPAWGRSLFEDTAEYGFGMALSIKGRRNALKAVVQRVVDEKLCSPELARLLEKWVKNFSSFDKVSATVDRIEELLPAEKDSHPLLARAVNEIDMFRPPSVWIIGGDGWAYDIGYNGVDHVLSRGENVNIMILDTEMYSNTGGQVSKASSQGSVLKFAQDGKREMKKDLGRLAMQYEHAYVASCAIGASYSQTLAAIREAEEYEGTSLLICFAPCIDWGIDMKTQMEWQKTAVESGYWKIYRYDPRLAKKGVPCLQLDAAKIKSEKMDLILEDQNRFAQLGRKDKDKADRMQSELKHHLDEVHDTYTRLTMDDEMLLDFLKAKVGEQTSEKMLVLYASETGTAQNLAKEFAGELKRRDVRARCVACDDYDFEELPNEKHVFFIAATCGQGEFPENSKEFWTNLSDPKLPSDYLNGVSFSVFGLGDIGYAYFNKVASDIDDRLEKLGATRLSKLGMGDDKAEEKWETAWVDWEPELYNTLELPTPPAVLAPPTYIVRNTDEPAQLETDRIMPAGASVLPLTVNQIRHPPGHDRDIRHFEVDLTGTGVSYNCGDSLGVYPWNAEARVEEFLEWYGVKGDTSLMIADPNEAGKFPVVSTSPRQLFTQALDLYGRPSRKFYERLAMIAKDSSEKSHLEHLLTKEGRAELLALGKETVGYADVMQMFPSAKPPLEYLVEFVPATKPRLYSIASSPDYDGSMLHMCIVADDWTTPKGVYKHGLTTGYLAGRGGHAASPTVINGRVNPAAFALPATPQTPVVLVALGTGIAPCRALIRDRLAQRDNDGADIGPMSLYYGVRFKASEYTYGDEWDSLHDNGKGPLTGLHCAFSRDQKHKIYVQHRLSENADEVYEYLVKNKGYYLLCGPSGPPVKAARDALEQAFVDKGGMSPEEANNYVTQMQIEGRYNEEVW